MIAGVLTLLLLSTEIEAVQCSLGVPVNIDYALPEDFIALPIEITDDFVLLQQAAGSITILPMVLDTLILPPLFAASDSIEIQIAAPVVTVFRTMPDTTWSVPVFPSPLLHSIPSGLAGDYLNRHLFWKRWGGAPANKWIPLSIFLLTLILVLSLFLLHRKKRNKLMAVPESSDPRKSMSPLDEVQALFDSKAFAEGRWPEYYRDVERLLRDTVAFRFGISNIALTLHQIRKQLDKNKDGRYFTNDSKEISREITLQRYAAWGGSRERAKKYTSKLHSLREEWHKR